MDDQVGAELERPAEVRRRERVVDDERRADLVRDRRGELDVEHVAAGVRDRLGEQRLRVRGDGAAPAVGVVHVHPVQGDLELAGEVVELRGRAAVERLRDRDPVARLEQHEEEPGLRGEAARESDGTGAALEVRKALLERGHGRIHDPAVDVAVLLQVEVGRRRFRVLEHEPGGLVDRRRARAGVRIRPLPGVHGARVEAEVARRLVHRASVPPTSWQRCARLSRHRPATPPLGWARVLSPDQPLDYVRCGYDSR